MRFLARQESRSPNLAAIVFYLRSMGCRVSPISPVQHSKPTNGLIAKTTKKYILTTTVVIIDLRIFNSLFKIPWSLYDMHRSDNNITDN